MGNKRTIKRRRQRLKAGEVSPPRGSSHRAQKRLDRVLVWTPPPPATDSVDDALEGILRSVLEEEDDAAS